MRHTLYLSVYKHGSVHRTMNTRELSNLLSYKAYEFQETLIEL